jgi:hypothetical protein
MLKAGIFLFAPACLLAQIPTVHFGVLPSGVTSGSTFTLAVSITASAIGWASVSWGITITNATLISTIPDGSLTTKYLTAGVNGNCVVSTAHIIGGQGYDLGINTITAATGLAVYTFQAGSSGTITLNLTNVSLADAVGAALSVNVGPSASISVAASPTMNFCDLSGAAGLPDAQVDGWDVGAENTWIVSGPPPGKTWDRFGDMNPARSAQAIISAATGAMCTATQ